MTERICCNASAGPAVMVQKREGLNRTGAVRCRHFNRMRPVNPEFNFVKRGW
jgi:hypothetical protein